jgi:hypothetical protein
MTKTKQKNLQQKAFRREKFPAVFLYCTAIVLCALELS